MARGARLAAAAAIVLVLASCGGEEPSQAPAAAGPNELNGPYQLEPFRAFDRAAIEPFERACTTGDAGMEPLVRPGLQPVLADARGLGRVMLVYRGADGAYADCTATLLPDGVVQLEGGSSGMEDGIDLGPLELGPASGSMVQSGAESWSAVNGRVGSGITRVVIELEDGTQVVASVASGYYAAWWPGQVQARRTIGFDAAGNQVVQ